MSPWDVRYIDESAVLVVVSINAAQDALWEQEALLAHDMTIEREREFCAARAAARYGMRQIGERESAILQGDAGEPIWPSTIVGSLSHTRTHAAAFIAPAAEFAALGVDLDDGRAIGDAAAADLMTPREVRLITDLGLAKDSATAQLLVFTAKEALFKCQFPLTKNGGLDFLDVELVQAAAGGIPPSMINNITGVVDSLYALEKRMREELKKLSDKDTEINNRLHEIDKTHFRVLLAFGIAGGVLVAVIGVAARSAIISFF